MCIYVFNAIQLLSIRSGLVTKNTYRDTTNELLSSFLCILMYINGKQNDQEDKNWLQLNTQVNVRTCGEAKRYTRLQSIISFTL